MLARLTPPRTLRFLVGAVLGLGAALGLPFGCLGGPAKMPAQVPRPEELVAQIEAHQRQARTLKAQARVEFWDNAQGDRLKARVSMWIARDGHLRFDVDSQVGPLSSLAVAGRSFQLLDVKNDQYYTGEVAPCNVERVIHVALPPAQIAAALLGDAPLLPHTGARVTWNGSEKRWVLDLLLEGGGRETIELGERNREVFHAELHDASGRRLWWLDHDDFSTIKGVSMPDRSRFQQGDKADQDVIIKMKSQDVNVTPPPQAWLILAPSGMIQQELRCDAR